jgi:hypothetical protein
MVLPTPKSDLDPYHTIIGRTPATLLYMAF